MKPPILSDGSQIALVHGGRTAIAAAGLIGHHEDGPTGGRGPWPCVLGHVCPRRVRLVQSVQAPCARTERAWSTGTQTAGGALRAPRMSPCSAPAEPEHLHKRRLGDCANAIAKPSHGRGATCQAAATQVVLRL